jgi:hypothetical protein
MRKHIYLHTSNLDYLSDIIHEDQFESVTEYDKTEFSHTHRNDN